MNLLARPSEWTRMGKDAASATPFAGGSHHYFAFMSYSHQDQALADWLQDQLEDFKVPRALVGRITQHGAIPRRLCPIFRDLKELPASDDLGTEIRAAISASRYLVVLCSPAAAKSRWAQLEIEAFKRVRPEGCILAVIASGEPFASDIPGREDQECLPRALRYKYDRRGRPTTHRAEPLAADLREPGAARRLGFLKLVAGMLGVGLDDLVRHDDVRRHRRLAILAAGSLAGMVVTSGLAVTAIQARDAARDQRREAEGLIGFMLGDLREKLEPLGRLDVLDSVGNRALAYYSKQDMSQLSDDALAQRSRALTLMGEIAQTRGDLGRALELYRAAYVGTGEAMRRDRQNNERLFDHAQNVFWIGYIRWQRGELTQAETAFREYKKLADAMSAREPTNPKYRLEVKYAETNLGIVLMDRNRFADAANSFEQALSTVEALATSDPRNPDYQKALLEALAWLADARKGEGQLDDALAQRERQLTLLNEALRTSPEDTEYSRKAMTAHKAISELLIGRGDLKAALDHARRAAAYASTLMQTEPGNTEWMEYSASTQFTLATLMRLTGDDPAAGAAIRSGCDMTERLVAKDSSVRSWSDDLRLDCAMQRARLSMAAGSAAEALSQARRALAVAMQSKGKSANEAGANRARAYLLYGDALAASGQGALARDAWVQSAQAWPQGVTLGPDLQAQQARSFAAIGRTEQARQIAARLEAIGYRHPDFETLRGGLTRGG